MGELSVTVGRASSAGYWPEENIPDLIDHELTGCHAGAGSLGGRNVISQCFILAFRSATHNTIFFLNLGIKTV